MSRPMSGGRRQSALILSAAAFMLLPVTSALAAPDYDGDGVVTGDCKPLDGGIHPGALDKPDLSFEDANCDGIDGDLAKAVFVSASAANDAGSGSKENPLKTFTAAIAKAKAEGKDVYAITGNYDQGFVSVEDGVGIYGGYQLVTGNRTSSETTLIKGAPQAVLADGDQGVTLQMLTLEGSAPDGPSQSAYGVRAVAGSKLVLEKVKVSAGNGRAGSNGTTPAAPGRAPDGTPGQPGPSCMSNSGGAGGGGGFTLFGNSGGSGGRGGGSSGSAGGTGFTGGGPFGGVGGAPGTRNANVGGNGNPGNPGGPGTQSGGSGANASGGLGSAGASYAGNSGGSGGAGAQGSGGGGGGGGAAGWAADVNHDSGGGGGGGGGAGGFGGGGGTGGTHGGGSFAVYLHDSTVAVIGSEISTGNGGNGGNGALGGGGGQGGFGGGGGAGGYCALPDPDTDAGNGGAGAAGGTGAAGGAGGGGAGGPSMGIVALGAQAGFVRRGTSVTTGTGGTGGNRGGTTDAAAGGQAIESSGSESATSDADGDAVPDGSDACPGIAAATSSGCPARPAPLSDADGDTVPDNVDKCPTAAGNPDADGDGCTDGTPPADKDNDGILPPVDCDDNNPNIKPTAAEVPDNDVDENCDGVKARSAVGRIEAGVKHAFDARSKRFTTVRRLDVTGLIAGATLQVRCIGGKKKGCQFSSKKRTFTLAAAKFSAKRYFNFTKTVNGKKRTIVSKLKKGAKIEIRVTKAGLIGKVVTFTMRSGKKPTLALTCLPVGSITPQKTC